MNRIILLFFLFSKFAFSGELEIKGLPKLTTLLITELGNQDFLLDADITKMNNLLSQSKQSHELMDKYLLKNLITQGASNSKKLKNLDQKLFDTLKLKIETIPQSTRPFTKFVYSSLLIDLGNLLTDPDYKYFLQYQKYKTASLEASSQKIKSRYSYISPWLRMLLEDSSEDFYKKIDILNQESFKNLALGMGSFARLENQKNFKVENYISKIDASLKKAQEEISKLSFQIAPMPDPNYVAPEKLPTPVADWEPVDEEIIENGLPLTRDQLFPEPDPNYVPPTVLPKPVDKWRSGN